MESILTGLDVRPLRGAERCHGRRLVEDSRLVKPGDVFLARLGGEVDGRDYIGHAEQRGAVVVVSDDVGCEAATVPAVLSVNPARDGAIIAQRLAGNPSEHVSVVGVTGTNGKTTVSMLLSQVLKGEGRSGLLGGVWVDDGAQTEAATLTTPVASGVAAWLGRVAIHRCDRAVMEVSSHALDQHRVAGIQFAAAIFTNLSGDHLEYHGTMEAYADCKRRLFDDLPGTSTAIINSDDPVGDAMVAQTSARVIRCSLRGGGDVRGVVNSADMDGISMQVESPWGSGPLRVPLVGEHNAMNALQAMTAACALGVALPDAVDRIATAIAPPGRLERVCERPQVLVDFAHTDAALEAVLRSLQTLKSASARILLVVGCGGDRDPSKRPRMAAIAATMSDRVWLTSDNPRSEDPAAILEDMSGGVPAALQDRVTYEVDRQKAIESAIHAADPDDIVLIAGKGHECTQLACGVAVPFDDRRVALAAMQAKGACS